MTAHLQAVDGDPLPGLAPVLIVECVNADQFPGRVNKDLPLLRGYYEARGCSTEWVRFALSTTNMMEHDRNAVTLADGPLSQLTELAHELSPGLVVFTDPIYEPQRQAIIDAAGTPRTVVFDNLHHGPYRGLFERRNIRPRYDWKAGNPAAEQRRIDNVYLLSATGCGHRGRLDQNVRFEDFWGEYTEDRVGCTFCIGSLPHDLTVAVTAGRQPDALTWTGTQIEALLDDSSRQGRFPNSILFEQLASDAVFERATGLLEKHGADGEVQLLFAIRTRFIPHFAGQIGSHFARRPDSPLRLGVFATGIESFCTDELLLYNKETTATHGLAAVRVLRELAITRPGQFWYTGVTFVLFTPWTTLQSLHLNYGLIHFLRMTRKEAGNMFQARLRFHPGLPLQLLAEHDGLFADEARDPLVVMNRRKLFGEERPWRCADPRVEPIMSIVLRYDLIDSPQADPLTERIHEALCSMRRLWTPGDDRTLLELTLCQIEVALTETDALDEDEILERARARWEAQRAARQARRECGPFRIGPERCDLDTMLNRAASLFKATDAPAVCRLRLPARAPADDDVLSAAANANLVARMLPSDDDERALLLGCSGDDLAVYVDALDRWQSATEGPERAEAAAALARLRGIPACCASHAAEAHGADPWATLAFRNAHEGAVAPSMNPLWVPAVAFRPCTPTCAAAADAYAAWFRALEVPIEEEDAVWVVTLDTDDDGDVARVPVQERDGETIAYAGAIEASDPSLGQRLAAGGRLTTVPGQIRVAAGDRVVDVMTTSHGLWDPRRGRHPETSAELQRSAEFARLHCEAEGAYDPPFGNEGGPKVKSSPAGSPEASKRRPLMALDLLATGCSSHRATKPSRCPATDGLTCWAG